MRIFAFTEVASSFGEPVPREGKRGMRVFSGEVVERVRRYLDRSLRATLER